MAGLLDTARPLDRFRTLLAPDPGWQYGSLAPLKTRTPLDPIYGAPQVMDTQFSLAIPDMAREMAGSLLTTLEAPYTGVMPKPADLLNITPMTSAPGLLFRAPAGAGPVFASGLTRRGIGDNQGPALGPDPAEVSPLGFYSPTEQAVLNLKQTTPMEPAQARASLANLGAKKEEMQWMGMDDFLAGRPSVTQDELLDFVRQNRVNVEQVNYGGPDPEALVRQADELMEQGQRVQASGDLDGARVIFGQHDDLMRRAEELAAGWDGERYGSQGLLAPKFSEHTLPGGENYREVVLTMPSRVAPEEKSLSVKELFRAPNGSVHYEWSLPDGTTGVHITPPPVEWYGVPSAQAVRNEILAKLDVDAVKRLGQDFTGGHFPDANALAHVRMNDRIDADGKKVLFIEEMQSDWHHLGRRHGYAERPAEYKPPEVEIHGKWGPHKDDFRNEWDDAISPQLPEGWIITPARTLDDGEGNIPDYILQDVSENGFVILDGRTDPVGFGETREAAVHSWLREVASREPLLGMVPDAPFKQSWSDLSMMRIMKMAADEGYDRVAWTTGRMQADRYDLSRQIDELFVAYGTPGTVNLSGTKGGYAMLNNSSVEISKLDDFVGKEIADKIRKHIKDNPPSTAVADAEKRIAELKAATSGDITGRGNLEQIREFSDLNMFIGGQAPNSLTLSGIDLKVGGEWAVKFYDEMLPTKAQKIARRLDKDAKVGRTTLEKIEPYNVTDPRVPYPIKKFKNQDVWSIDITPAMRKSIGRQPLFSANPGAAAAPGLLSTQQPAPPPSLIMDSRERVPRSLLDDAA